MWRLLYPLRYFSLRNSEKAKLDLIPTAILTLLIAAPYIVLPEASFFRSGGFLDKILTLMSALTGFYVAALVAAATFAHPDLDKVITVGAITIRTRDLEGDLVDEPLTRREFACTLFGYLAFASFFISVISAMAVTLSGPVLKMLERFVADSNATLVFHEANLTGWAARSLLPIIIAYRGSDWAWTLLLDGSPPRKRTCRSVN